ncbi:non-canonical purine NTP diphosphatase [Carboxylicivirga sediminis]|uniref:dITP/XTP pyrophosphatase n=1 Tax=Carboxylicivirga sediminis TaxID=2006564 RepID=A0A941F5B8_9BACT|nr:non-canonical purine NTP diphosphatase [Carboxylicivirga sediminis]MBR8537081.1 non-canonical purine NTP diphosphatase [Carboxylicivirga sediminis]
MELVFATNNEHKLREIQLLLGTSLKLLSLKDIGCNEEIPETGTTLEANARQKSEYIFNKFGLNCFADDTGLEIDALNGEPGVYSARYAGADKDAEANMNKVLDLMSEENHRKARFRTVISLFIDGKEHQFEGVVEGVVLRERSGKEGFGYDPIFTPDGYQQSFAEMAMELKNEISHRGRAIKKLIDFLKEHYG